jgi:transposase-like protein
MDGASTSQSHALGDGRPHSKPIAADWMPSAPDVLAREHFQQYVSEFSEEYQPVGPTERALVRDLARQAAAVERWSAAAEAVERTAVHHLPKLAGTLGSDELVADALLAGAMATESAQECERHSLARSRAFCRSLTKLQQLQAARARGKQVYLGVPFAGEAACEAYLERRLRGAQFCLHCGHHAGCYLPSRRVWECNRCRKQRGLRAGTVMAGSALPLLVWCEAVRVLLWRPTMGMSELGGVLRITRNGTVRNIACRIREAMAADDATERLAGLDLHFARPST